MTKIYVNKLKINKGGCLAYKKEGIGLPYANSLCFHVVIQYLYQVLPCCFRPCQAKSNNNIYSASRQVEGIAMPGIQMITRHICFIKRHIFVAVWFSLNKFFIYEITENITATESAHMLK